MSGWLGAMNYGVIVANEVDSQLMTRHAGRTSCFHDLVCPQMNADSRRWRRLW